MNEHVLRARVEEARLDLGCPVCKKYCGAVTTELLKVALQLHGIETSPRDVFIENVPVELDLLIPRRGAPPRHGILYRAEDVLMAFEVKYHGSFGERTIEKTNKDFQLVSAKNAQIRCAYVTLLERRTYKWRVTKENLGFPAYTLFWYRGSSESSRQYEASGDFDALLNEIREVTGNCT
jgi:hypothetical protein